MKTNTENPGVSKYTISFGVALALASVVNGLLVIAKEKIPAVMAGMQKLTGHHWLTHCIIVLGIFVVSGWILALPNGGQGMRMNAGNLIRALLAGVATGGVIILGFYGLGG